MVKCEGSKINQKNQKQNNHVQENHHEISPSEYGTGKNNKRLFIRRIDMDLQRDWNRKLKREKKIILSLPCDVAQ